MGHNLRAARILKYELGFKKIYNYHNHSCLFRREQPQTHLRLNPTLTVTHCSHYNKESYGYDETYQLDATIMIYYHK